MIEATGSGETVLMDLCRHDVSYAVAEAFRLSRLALCSATYDAGIFPPMYNFLHHLASKNFRGRHVGLVENGSWSPIAGKLMGDMLARMKDMTISSPIVTIRSRMHRNDIPALQALAASITKA